VLLDLHTGEPVCKTASTQARTRLASEIKRLAPQVKLKVDGSFLILDLPAAVALRSQRADVRLRWSDDAAGLVDNFASAYANWGRARHRLWQLQQDGIADEALARYPRAQNLDPHQRVAVVAMTESLIKGICLFDELGVGKTMMEVH